MHEVDVIDVLQGDGTDCAASQTANDATTRSGADEHPEVVFDFPRNICDCSAASFC